MARKWISKAIKKKGSFRKAAKSAGMSTAAFAQKKKKAKGTIGRRARLAITLAKLRKGKK